VLITGPGQGLGKSFIAQNLGYPYSIPEHSEVSNALGVALARTTAELTILADTEKKRDHHL
jgi:hypothetical protein